MKFLVILTVCIAASSAAPGYGSPAIRAASPPLAPAPAPAPRAEAPSYYAQPADMGLKSKKEIKIVKLAITDDNAGNFDVESISEDGSVFKNVGTSKDLGDKEGTVSVMSGSYSFVGDDGKTYTVAYTADENGFRATGDHLPTPPPIPADIQKSLDESSKSSSDSDSGMYYESPAPAVRSAYSAPAPAPVVRSSYSAPAPAPVVRSSYSAPAPTLAPAPVVRSSYSAPAPAVVRSSAY